ncbi:MAG: CARDB domain-containing protein [Deltaproteobacteria bacterium]|nr:CARDB domain-containing protein [Deltaproteobacteria bacterium]
MKKLINRKPSRKKATVTFSVPKTAFFVGSYHRIRVRLIGVTFDKVNFVVPDGAKAAVISPSRDATFNPKQPHIMLCVGPGPGTYVIEARHVATNALLGQAKFSSDALWLDENAGPTKCFTGISKGYSVGAAWGGGPAGPQNTNTSPATGTRRIAVLLVDTSTQRFTSDAPTLQGFRDRWMDEIINGVTTGGVVRSTQLFYREASYNNFDISAQVFGPVSLSGTFDDYFNADGSPKGTFYQACFTAGDGLIDYNNFDSLLCISQQVDGVAPQAAWPYASIGNWGPYTTAEGNKNFGVISMSNSWGTASRMAFETFSHELGHNLGLGDQYTPAVAGRNPGGWEMMHEDESFPHFSIAHRMILGWVQPNWLQTFNFQSMAAPVDQAITLSPIENGAPPAGRNAGVEIRLADGWNYYFEYRIGQTAQIGDRSLPTDNRVLGTDVVSAPYSPPISRPGILLLNSDIDGDGAVLGNNQDYEETDTTDPVYPTDFKVDVSGINNSKADLRIRYGVNSKPDPSIRPWPAAPDRQWQSPDIEIQNARNLADSAWFNVPWVGNMNTIIARIKNNGGLDAPQVRANFYVKNYNVGGAPETFLGTDVRDVPAGATVDFQGSWTPPAVGHFCVIVRIPLYQLPANPAVVEMTELNNLAQSNYDRFISTTSTPSREITTMEVGNPYPVRTRIWINASNSNPLYRTYLEHSWVYLNPGETRKIQVMYEYAPDHLTSDVYPKQLLPKYREMQRMPNRVAFASFIENPRDNPRHSLEVLGGAQAEVVTGKSTEFQRFVIDGRTARGTVVTHGDKKPVPSGKVVVRVTSGKGLKAKVDYQSVRLQGGSFVAKLRYEGERLKAFYIPSPGYGDSESEEKHIR